MPVAFIWFYKPKMAETKMTFKKRFFFSFVNNSYSYWQNSTKFHAKVEYTYWNNIQKFFLILLISTIFPPTAPFDPVSRYTPVSPILTNFPVSLLITCFTHTGFANVLLGAIFWKFHHYYPLPFSSQWPVNYFITF
jgi:hypothetical protein